MSDSILQKYVDAALLNKRVIKNAEDLDSLKKASAQLVKKLKQKNYKSNLIPFILVGINPKIRPDEPLLDEVETIIKSKNKLFVSRSKDRSVTIIRSVILHTLERMTKDDMAVSATIYLAGSKYFEYIKYSVKEKALIKQFLLNLGIKVEKHSTDLWTINPINFKSIEQPEYPESNLPTDLRYLYQLR